MRYVHCKLSDQCEHDEYCECGVTSAFKCSSVAIEHYRSVQFIIIYTLETDPDPSSYPAALCRCAGNFYTRKQVVSHLNKQHHISQRRT